MFDILKKSLGQSSYKTLSKYVDNLQMLTDIIGEGKQKGGIVMKFKQQYGGGEVRFASNKEMVGFIKALHSLSQILDK